MTDSPTPAHTTVQSFIDRWKRSAASERSNYALFLTELCDVLGLPHPDPAGGTPDDDAYVIDRAVTFTDATGSVTTNYIDLYKRGCFVLEAKQGSHGAGHIEVTAPDGGLGLAGARRRRGTAVRNTKGWDTAMWAARGQAEQYVRALPAADGNPPFIVVADIGHCFDLYADFSRAGKHYIPFPDAMRQRIMLDDLVRPDVQETLRLLWTDPLALDPTRRSARVTRDVADRLARLAKSLEASGHAAVDVAAFLMRTIFTMFAEDVKLLPERGFQELLESLRGNTGILPDMLRSLWTTMDTGGFSPILKANVHRFNGGLFESTTALPLTDEQLALLIDAARADWRDVEPAIFGTLVERALDPIERHRLGAHYTPRAYVERLVMPTVIEPLRAEWEAAKVAAVQSERDGSTAQAVEELRAFHRQLCATRVLDPACGTGNFLYVTMEHMKRLEGEVLTMLAQAGQTDTALELTELTVDPHQFLGIEINPRAAAIADLVLWIGFLQWHFRTHGDAMPREPVLRRYHNIECRDALLEYDGAAPMLDDDGAPRTRWDGRTKKLHPVTGEPVPDEAVRVPMERYINPRRAAWPACEYIVGNPPFIGTSMMRHALGDGYTEAVRATYADVPESVDLVMYWWDHAAALAREGTVKRFGLITTNSLRQTFNRRVVARHLESVPPLSLMFAIPDHPWVDAVDGAAVRIAMTVGEAGVHDGSLVRVVTERDAEEQQDVVLETAVGRIGANLAIGANLDAARPLRANDGLANRGMQLIGSGFIVTSEQARTLGLGTVPELERYVRPYRNGRDLAATPRDVMVIDLFGLSERDVRERFPSLYQHVLLHVKPERDQNARATYRDRWWLFGEPRANFRPALVGLPRYIATVETSKHRFFVFLDASILPDNMLVNIALDDAYHLGVLSSRVHVTWALAAGGRLGVGNDPRYNKTRCFDPFPLPDASPEQAMRIRDLGERLDAHRKRQQERHPDLTMTEMYNVLEKIRAGTVLSTKERKVHDDGLVSVLKEIHDDLDAAVFTAYGWPVTLTDEEIVAHVVALNQERAQEEANGHVRWLRPDYQNPKGAPGTEQQIAGLEAEPTTERSERARKKGAGSVPKAPWPHGLREQALAVRTALGAHVAEHGTPATAAELTARFIGARKPRVAEILATLAELGQIRDVEGERYVV